MPPVHLLDISDADLLIALSASWAGVWLLIAIDAVLLAILAIEYYRVEIAHRPVPMSSKPLESGSATADDS